MSLALGNKESYRAWLEFLRDMVKRGAALKLVFAVLVRASRRWQRVRFAEEDLEYLDKLRKELGLEVRDEGVIGV